MRMPWIKSKIEQLDLVDEANAEPIEGLIPNAAEEAVDPEPCAANQLESHLRRLNVP